LRRLVLAASACLVLLGLAVPTVGAAAPVNPKVVLIVGPVGGSTSSYKSDMDAAAAEAAKYTTNIVKVYTPKATWTAAKAALQGASIVVYMGHGNGWPSPYPPFQEDTKDGLGLNPSAGTDNTTTKYYGANYLASYVDLAPNAVVFLGHLCYSAGNSEPGNPDVSLSDAKKRVDNMAAGWIKAGARAVVAEPYTSGMYGGASWWIRQLFTTHRAIDSAWLASPSSNGNVLSFASTRSTGFTAKMDPGHVNAPPYERSIVEKTTLMTQDVTGARYSATDADPSSFVVPGAASVKVDGALLYPTADDATNRTNGAAEALDTRLRLDGPAVTLGGASAYPVHRLDDATAGFMFAADLRPRDSQGPNVWTADTGTGAFSPNGDGSQDEITVAGQLSEAATSKVSFQDLDGTELYATAWAPASNLYSASWDGTSGGSTVADGTYQFVVTARDAWGNPDGTKTGTIVVDTVAPSLAAVAAASSAGNRTFSPNGDGAVESIAFAFSTNEAGFIDLTAKNGAGATVRHLTTTTSAGAGSVTWTGDNDSDTTVADGTYDVTLRPRDLAGNRGAGRTESVDVYTALRSARTSSSVFFPQDGDSVSRSVAFSFVLSRAASVTWTIQDANGVVLATRYTDQALAAGTYTWGWNGKNTAGAYVPRGRYYSTITANDGPLSFTQKSYVQADAFRIVASDTTPGRGQSVTVTAYSAEALGKAAHLYVYQPGHSSWYVTMTKVGTNTYRATVKLFSSGSTGQVRFRVTGFDSAGHAQESSLYLPLH
jgi:flagellar hook assembly protein FlgD